MLAIPRPELTRAVLTSLHPRLLQLLHGRALQLWVVLEVVCHAECTNPKPDPISPLAHFHIRGVPQPSRGVVDGFLRGAGHFHHRKTRAPSSAFPFFTTYTRRIPPSTMMTRTTPPTLASSRKGRGRGDSGCVRGKDVVAGGGFSLQ